jgi:formylglycine-generating enzyme required for sulfatase activity
LRRGESTLVLDVTPVEARVLLDGVEVPEREVALAAGIYQLRVEALGWVAFERRVVLPTGWVERVAVALEPLRGTLVLDVQPPQASVSVDGVAIAGGSVSLPVGVRRVVVSAEGFEPASFEVEVAGDAVVERSVRLVELLAWVMLDVQPPDARVTVNGEARGSAFEVPSGSYEVVVSHPDYVEERLRLVLGPGERAERVVTLAPQVRVAASASLPAAPTYVRLANARVEVDGGAWEVTFDVSWDESWRGPDRPSWVAAADNWDAVWVFVKYRVDGGAWQHATLAASGHLAPAGAVVDVAGDGVGAFIYRDSRGYGTFTANGVRLQWDHVVDGVPAGASTVDVRPFAIEMVFVPGGSFSLGSGGSSTGEFRAGGTASTPFVVSSQSSLALGNAVGQLNWTSGMSSGSPSGSTNASFPTGYGGFYVMKHELTQRQFVGFLNTLSQTQADVRTGTGSSHRYGITGDRLGSYATSLPYVAMNYTSWADGVAFADWAGLRPMTELEYEKAARGPLAPVAREYAWGSRSIARATGLVNAGAITETPTPESANAAYGTAAGVQGPVRTGGFAAPGDSRRDAGAGYYGALELSGNLWERTVTVGNAEGRAFTGAHGDGTLDVGGDADVASWPGASAVGAGIRGGDWMFYSTYLETSNRFLAANGYALRTSVYGWRGARSAP